MVSQREDLVPIPGTCEGPCLGEGLCRYGEIKDLAVKRSSWIVQEGPKCLGSPVRGRQREIRQLREEEGAMKMETGIGVMWPQAKECVGLPGASRS